MAKRSADVKSGLSLSGSQVKDICDRLFVRHQARIDGIIENREKFYRAAKWDPTMGELLDPTGELTKYQTTLPFDVMMKALPRLTENPWQVGVNPPRDTSTMDRNANDLKTVLNAGYHDVETRNGTTLQHSMSVAQVRDGCFALHWYPVPEIWGTEVDYEWAGSLPEDPGEAKRFEDMATPCPMCAETGMMGGGASAGVSASASAGEMGSVEWGGKPCPECKGVGQQIPDEGRYRETDAALQERRASDRARAGFPMAAEVVDPTHVAWEPGRGHYIGHSRVAIKMELSRVDYDSARQDGLEPSKVPASSWTIAPGEQLAQGEAATSHETPSSMDFRERVTVYQLWNMALKGKGKKPEFEFYELMLPSGQPSGEELVKAFKRPGARMNPWAIGGAIKLDHPDPALEHNAYLKSLYDQKPFRDRVITLLGSLIELNAQPLYYYRKVDASAPALLSAEGKDSMMTRSTVLQSVVPPGYEIAVVPFEMNPAMAQFAGLINQEFAEAAPSTGFAEIGANTAPWTGKIATQQANVPLAMLTREQAGALQLMFQDTAYTMSLETVEEGGFGEDVSVFGRTKDGKVDRSKTVSVAPKDVASLDVEVSISPTSSSEVIAATQAGMELLSAGLMTEEEFHEIRGKENPADYVIKLMVERLSKAPKEQLVLSAVAQWMGPKAYMGINGMLMDAYGHPLMPQQVLAQNGFQSGAPQGPTAAQGGLGNQGASSPGPLPAMDVPGAGRTAGVPG